MKTAAAFLMLAFLMAMSPGSAHAGVVQGTWPGTAGPKAASTYFGYPYPNALPARTAEHVTWTHGTFTKVNARRGSLTA